MKSFGRVILLMPSLLFNIFSEYNSEFDNMNIGQVQYILITSILLVTIYFILERLSESYLKRLSANSEITSRSSICAVMVSWFLIIFVLVFDLVASSTDYKKWKRGVSRASYLVEKCSKSEIDEILLYLKESRDISVNFDDPRVSGFTAKTLSDVEGLASCLEKKK